MSTYGGHPGLVYDRTPNSFSELMAGTEVWTDRTFLVHGERRVTFAGFRAAAQAARAYLADLGIRPGDRVLVFGYNSPEWVVALWALWLEGAVPVLANRWWSGAEIDHAVSVLAPRHVLADTTLDVPVPVSPLDQLRAVFDGPRMEASPPSNPTATWPRWSCSPPAAPACRKPLSCPAVR